MISTVPLTVVGVAILALLGSPTAEAQVTWVSSVGTGQVVPDPWNPTWPSGRLCLEGIYCPLASQQLSFELIGMPIGYSAGPINYEFCYFGIDVGASSLPGVPIAGGQFYVPFLTPVAVLAGPSLYIGPSDIVCVGGSGIGCGVAAPTRNGARLRMVRPPGTFGALTVQGFVLDASLGRIFTSNAVNFTLP